MLFVVVITKPPKCTFFVDFDIFQSTNSIMYHWPSITEWEMHITAQGHMSVSAMTYTVSSGTLNSTIPYPHIMTKCQNYITVAWDSNLVTQYLNIGRKLN